MSDLTTQSMNYHPGTESSIRFVTLPGCVHANCSWDSMVLSAALFALSTVISRVAINQEACPKMRAVFAAVNKASSFFSRL